MEQEMIDYLIANDVAWHSFPLCRRYRLVCLERLTVRAVQKGVASDRTLCWAFGMLADGEYEVLGVWPELLSCRSSWQQVFADLKARGVERIQFVSSSESAPFRSVLGTAYPGVKVLPPVSRLETVSALPSRYRNFIRASADAVRLIQRGTIRMAHRHGCISSLANAPAFVANALKRAEQRIEFAARTSGDPASKHLRASRTRPTRPERLSLVR
jgi:hypothetical protein